MILLTRTVENSINLAKEITTRNLECMVEPMLEINQLNKDIMYHIISSPQAVVITSRNARHILPDYVKTINIPEHGKNAAEILQYLEENMKKDGGKIVYLSGNIVTLDIAEELKMQGFDAEREVVYESTPPEDFSKSFLEKIDKIKIAIFFSSETLRNFLQLIEKHNLQTKLQNITMLAFSRKIAEHNEASLWKEVHYSHQPDEESLLEKLDEITS